MVRFGLILLLAACSHHPPDALVNQTIINPICIIRCEASNTSPVVKGNSNAQIGAERISPKPST